MSRSTDSLGSVSHIAGFSEKVSSKPPVPKARPKVDKKNTPTKKQLMMKEGKTKKDSNVKFDSEVKKGKK